MSLLLARVKCLSPASSTALAMKVMKVAMKAMKKLGRPMKSTSSPASCTTLALAMKVMKAAKLPMKVMKAGKKGKVCTDMVPYEGQEGQKASDEQDFELRYQEYMKGRNITELNAKEVQELLKELPNIPNRTMYNHFHAAMAQNSSLPKEMIEDHSFV